MKINASNYFLASRGVFRTAPRKVLEKVLSLEPTIILNGRRWSLNHVSESFVGLETKPRPHSVYYVSEDGCWLIRASTHWCTDKPCATKGRAYICKKIARCHWSLDRCGQTLEDSAYRDWQAGIVKFSDLREN